MSFQVHLAQVIDGVEGSLSCLVMSQDGLVVDAFHHPQPDIALDTNTLGIEYTPIFQQLFAIHQQTQTGNLQEIAVWTDRIVAIYRFLSPEYFLLLTMSPQGNFGKGRYLLRLAASRLQQELF